MADRNNMGLEILPALWVSGLQAMYNATVNNNKVVALCAGAVLAMGLWCGRQGGEEINAEPTGVAQQDSTLSTSEEAAEYSVETSAESGPKLGDEGYLESSSARVFFSRTEQVYDRVVRAAINRDRGAVAQMVLDGSVLLVESGTRAKLVERKMGVVRVRVTSGEHSGEEGWVAMEDFRDSNE